MDQELELLQSRMTLLVAKCVDALHARIIDLQEQMAHLQREHQTLQAQVHQNAASGAAAETERDAPGKLSPEQKRQIQESLKMLGALSGWGRSPQDGPARFGLPLLAACSTHEHRHD